MEENISARSTDYQLGLSKPPVNITGTSQIERSAQVCFSARSSGNVVCRSHLSWRTHSLSRVGWSGEELRRVPRLLKACGAHHDMIAARLQSFREEQRVGKRSSAHRRLRRVFESVLIWVWAAFASWRFPAISLTICQVCFWWLICCA